jgi:UPF0176 protein
MQLLHNRISKRELKARLFAETVPRITVSLYKYFTITDPKAFRDEVYLKFSELNVFGRIYIAHEGINAQISVPENNFGTFKETLYGLSPELNGIRLNIAIDDDGKSFWVLKCKVRPKIVADGITDPSFDASNVGQYLKADEVNRMIGREDTLFVDMRNHYEYEVGHFENASNVGQYLKADEVNRMIGREDTLFVDMRNHYEYEVGHFENALEIPSNTFREQLPMAAEMLKEHKDKKIVMYCTGGIRCEKASAYLRHKGFPNLFHVEGGVIEYVRRAREQNLPLKFVGKNFVFDGRMGERITDDVIAKCHQCGAPCDNHTNCNNDGCHLLFIQCDGCRSKYEGCCSDACMEEHHLPAEEQQARRSGRIGLARSYRAE